MFNASSAIDRLLVRLEKEIEKNKKTDDFNLIWENTCNEYERKFGRDKIFNLLFIGKNKVKKEMLNKIRNFPASREFVGNMYAYVKELIEDMDNICYINFVIIFCNHLLYCKEFSEKIIQVRADIEKIKNPSANDPIGQSFANFLDEFIIEHDYFDNSKIIDLYADNYDAVMFMQQKDEAQVKLRDIYVENEYEFVEGTGEIVGLLEYIENFCSSDTNLPILFIEGHAGIGKSSLISKLAYIYRKKGNLWGKSLVVIQMRNLLVKEKNVNLQNPWLDFKKYVHFTGNTRKFMDLMNETIVILDGFDELCLIDNIKSKNKIKYVSNICSILKDYYCNCKVILTTRPNYLAMGNEYYNIFENPIVIQLCHFSVKKRIEWIELAKEAGMEIDSQVEKSVTEITENDIDVVASTPFTLYLIAHEGVVISQNDELWSIYQKIFGKEIMQKRYDRLNMDGENAVHPGEPISSMIYDITKEISNYMYQNGKMDILWDDIEEKVDKFILKSSFDMYGDTAHNNNIKTMLKDSFALFNYYTETDQGGISFYHNYIREFFLQETISEGLNDIFMKARRNRYGHDKIISELYNLIKYNRLSDKAIHFMISYGNVHKRDRSLWINIENQYHYIRDIFTDILIGNSEEFLEEFFILNLWLLSGVVQSVTGSEYIDIYEVSKIAEINEKNRLLTCLEMIARNTHIRKVNFSKVNWRGQNLNNIFFDECNFNHAEIAGGSLDSVDFVDCKMHSIDMRGTSLNKVSFDASVLRNAKFNGAIIKHCSFTLCEMEVSHLEGSIISDTFFIESNIEKADLHGTDFGNASFSNRKQQILDNLTNFDYALVDEMIWRESGELIFKRIMSKKKEV